MIGNRRFHPARLLRLALFALAVAGFARGAWAEATPAFAAWFKYGEEVTETWRILEGKDDVEVVIRRKDATPEPEAHRVLVLYPRPSSAYDTAITRILEVFAEKNLNAEFTVVNFNKDDALGQAALQLASDGDFDLIFSMGSESTAWLFDHYRGGTLPVVSVCSKDPVQLGQVPSYDSTSGTNFAFTSLNMPIDAQMA